MAYGFASLAVREWQLIDFRSIVAIQKSFWQKLIRVGALRAVMNAKRQTMQCLERRLKRSVEQVGKAVLFTSETGASVDTAAKT
jgi:hypothetical protein